jgi:hypothetical protein
MNHERDAASGFPQRHQPQQGDHPMDNETKEEAEVQRKKKVPKEPLPFCTDAPSAEHSRADSEDAPCDDSRSGK